MFDSFFKFKENGTDFKTEIIAGITTFLAMAYILGVNPAMLAEGNMPAIGVFFSTAVASCVACIVMGLVSKYPVGLAPGMGLNALFTYTIILTMHNTWETALAAVFVSFFDATGTLVSLGRKCGFIDKDGKSVGIEKAFLGDAIAGVIGFICGTSTLTAYVESATGIGLGGKTGLTAIVTGILFILSIFISPLILSLFAPPVTASALVIVGILMIIQLKDVEWDNYVVAASVFMTIIMMILTYSISLGIAWGFVIYAVASIAVGKAKELSWGIWALAIIFILYCFLVFKLIFLGLILFLSLNLTLFYCHSLKRRKFNNTGCYL